MLLLDMDILDVVLRLEPADEDVLHEKRKWGLVSKTWHPAVSALFVDDLFMSPFFDAAAVFMTGLATVGDVRSIVAGMHKFRQFPLVQVNACKALQRVDDYDGLQAATADGHIVRVLADLMKKWHGFPFMKTHVCLLFARICMHTDVVEEHAECLQIMVDAVENARQAQAPPVPAPPT